MTYKSYLETGGTRCPKCNSKAIKASSPPEKEKEGSVTVAMFCATCGARWQDLYTLTKAQDL